MITLAAEGGYQVFKLGSSEWFWLIFSAGTALLEIAVGCSEPRGLLCHVRQQIANLAFVELEQRPRRSCSSEEGAVSDGISSRAHEITGPECERQR